MQQLLIPFVVVLVLSQLYKSAMPASQSSEWPERTVAYANPFRYLVYVFWLCMAGFLVLVLVEGPSSRGELITVICMFLAFGALVLAMHLEIHIVSIAYDDDGIRTTSPWRSSRQVPWRDVSRIEYSHAAQWYLVETNSSGKVRCHVYLTGLQEFLRELSKRGYDPASTHPFAR